MPSVAYPYTRLHNGFSIPYTSGGTDTPPGTVIVSGTLIGVTTQNIPANTLGAMDVSGVFQFPKDASTFSLGDAVYWNATGNPQVGTAGSGCATSTASGNTLMGFAEAAQVTGDNYMAVVLNPTKITSTVGGAITYTSLTGSAATAPINGLAAAQGGSVIITGGTSSTSGNAGGAVGFVGGTPGATGVGGTATVTGGIGGSTSGAGGAASVTGGAGTLNAAGGVASLTGGAGQGTGAGAAVNVTGGASGAGATGNGGLVTITGGAALSTNGTGGGMTIAGGVATGTGTGGALTLTAGASAGASGTAGAAKIDAGAAAGGTGSYVAIGDVNTKGTYLNRGPLAALQVGLTLTAVGTSQSSTPTAAQLLGGLISQTGSTGAGTVTLPSGTAVSAACPRTPVVGDTFDCYFYNLGGSQTLTITGATGTTVVGTAAVGTGKMAQMKFYNSGSNAWSIYCIVSA